MNEFNENEYRELCTRFNSGGLIEDVCLNYANISYFNKMKASVQKDRRGEVVFCVIRPNGRIVAITCSEYPQGIFRIPTGGIGHNEDIGAAVYREVGEELGLQVSVRSFAGVVRIMFEHAGEKVMFYSYVFILDEKSGRLLEDASDDEISEVREVDLDGLEGIVASLGGIQGKWNDWGRFRQVTSGFVLKYLRSVWCNADSPV